MTLTQQFGMAPTVPEVLDLLKLRSKGTIHKHIDSLIRKRLLVRLDDFKHARCYRPIDGLIASKREMLVYRVVQIIEPVLEEVPA